MNYDEYNACIKILQKKPGWFGKDDIDAKLECLETFRLKGAPSSIHGILSFLRDDNEAISLRAAEVIASLSDKIKSLNQLYDSLKYLPISTSDVDFYVLKFQGDVAVKLLGIASLNHNGYVRQKAVEMLGQIDNSTVIRYLIVRLGDWVSNVRDAATLAIKNFFIDKYRESFINELLSIESFKQISRVDLSSPYKLIIDYVVEKRITKDYYNSLSVTDTARLLYLKKYIERHGIDRGLLLIMISDQNFLIRGHVLQYVPHLDSAERRTMILTLLDDNSSQVRLRSLYCIKAEVSSYYEVILKLTSDLSASVRDLARYLLRSYQLDFRNLYRKRIASETIKVGSILGLSEVGNTEDLDVLITLLDTKDTSIKLVCLNGISRIDLQQGRIYALQLIPEESNRIRKRCIDILSRSWDADVMAEVERIYVNANTALKKSILVLYNSVGGWDILSFLIRAVSEDDKELRNLGWSFLQRWRERALRLFTKPPKEAIDRAKGYYEDANIDEIMSGSNRQTLWSEIRYYLRYD